MKKLKNISFKYKILSLALIIIITLTLSIVFSITNTFTSILHNIIFENEKNNISKNSEIISNWFQERRDDLEIYANTTIMKEGNWDEKKNYLQSELAKRTKDYYFFFIADKNGNYSTTMKDNAGNISDRKYFPEIMKGNTVISNAVISKSTSKPIIVIGTPIKKNNKTNAVLAAVMRIDKLSSKINKYKANEKGIYSFLINNKGNIIAHPDQNKLYDYLANNNYNFNFSNKFINKILEKDKGNFKWKINNNTNYTFYHNIPDTDNWKIVTVLPNNYLKN